MTVNTLGQLRESLKRSVREKGYRKEIVKEIMDQLGRVVGRYEDGKETYVVPRLSLYPGVYEDNADMLRRRGLVELHYKRHSIFGDLWTVTPTERCIEIYKS